MQKGKSQNGRYKKRKDDEFSEKNPNISKMLVFSENLVCFVFL